MKDAWNSVYECAWMRQMDRSGNIEKVFFKSGRGKANSQINLRFSLVMVIGGMF